MSVIASVSAAEAALLAQVAAMGGELLPPGAFEEDDLFADACAQPMVVQVFPVGRGGPTQQLIDGVSKHVLQVELDDE